MRNVPALIVAFALVSTAGVASGEDQLRYREYALQSRSIGR